jgi:hypothetical protein
MATTLEAYLTAQDAAVLDSFIDDEWCTARSPARRSWRDLPLGTATPCTRSARLTLVRRKSSATVPTQS